MGIVGRYWALANLPRSVFLNRQESPLVAISLRIAEYTVVTMLPKVA